MSEDVQIADAEEAAYQSFAARWRTEALKAVDPGLHARIVDQQRMFFDAMEEGDDEETRIHGEAMIRGWQAANKRMEDEEIGKALRAWPGAKVIAIRPKS